MVVGVTQQWCLHGNNKYGKTRVLVTALPAWVVHIHESQYKAWGSPRRELTKVSKKNSGNGFILKGEMGNSSGFCCV
jgi:hypothetical protein